MSVPDLRERGPGRPARADRLRCRQLLPGVSRTFALTIRVLPGGLRDTVTVAYLLCRLADVVEDACGLDPEVRIAALESFADALGAGHGGPSAFERGAGRGRTPPQTGVPLGSTGAAAAFAPRVALAGERHALSAALDAVADLPLDDPPGRRLLAERDVVVRTFLALGAEERAILARWVGDMARGMAGFVARERHRDLEAPAYRLETADELRSYAYCVAGTVGELLTDLFQLHLGAHRVDGAALRARAVPFGLGLQLTNILQDLREDRLRGWSYLPEEIARRHGTSISALVAPSDRGRAARAIEEVAREAAANLDQAMEFTLLIPRSAPRIRLFCLWPIFFALRTLQGICADTRVLEGGEKVKISRAEVRALIRKTALRCCSDGSLARLYRAERTRFAACLDAVTP